jgi:Flp pilus assembly protein TadG
VELYTAPTPDIALRAKRARQRGERGQSLVEFALIAPVFFILVFGIVDFGLGLRAWITVTNSAREAARYAAVTCATASADEDLVVDRAVNTSAGLLIDDDVEVENCPGESTESVVVSVQYDYDLITPLAPFLTLISAGTLSSTITIESATDMRLE